MHTTLFSFYVHKAVLKPYIISLSLLLHKIQLKLIQVWDYDQTKCEKVHGARILLQGTVTYSMALLR